MMATRKQLALARTVSEVVDADHAPRLPPLTSRADLRPLAREQINAHAPPRSATAPKKYKKDKYAIRLGKSAIRLFRKGVVDPDAEDLAREAWVSMRDDTDTDDDDCGIPGGVADEIRKKLKRVRDYLQEVHRLPVYLVNYAYYHRFNRFKGRLFGPSSQECVACIAGVGGGHSLEKYKAWREHNTVRPDEPEAVAPARGTAWGLRLNTQGANDPLYKAMLSVQLGSGGGKVREALIKVGEAMAESRLTVEEAAILTKELQGTLCPDDPDVVAQVASVLPAGFLAAQQSRGSGQ